jgi:Ca2+-binding RTX toxin-like protein
MAKIGYYYMDDNQGAAYQADVIADIGQSALQLTTLANLGASAVVYLDNGNGGSYNADFLTNQSHLLDFVNAGGVLMMHDRFAGGTFVGGYTHDTDGPYSADINFVNDTGKVADGPFGQLTDFSLDHYDLSNHGVADISGWQDSRIFVVTTSMDPTKLVTMVQALGDGELIYSSIPVDFWVGDSVSGHDANMTAYTENLLSYAVQLHNLTTVHLTSAAETLDGAKTADKIFADAGADLIDGRAGDDLIDGGKDDDRISGSKGDDILWGGDGVDQLKGGAGNDQLWGQELHDKLIGGDGDDYMVGGSGNDDLRGGDGNDTAIGGSGNDVIDGGDFFDEISGGKGADTMTGGIAADIFYFGPTDSPVGPAHDVVTDFVHDQDLIDLTGYQIDWVIHTTSTFSHTANELLIYSGGPLTTFVAMDFDGDANADAFIEVRSTAAEGVADVTDFQF